jgi:hypothetical protein
MEVIKMGSKIEAFVTTKKVLASDIYLNQNPEETQAYIFEHLERQFRENLSWYGLVIEDSLKKIIKRPPIVDGEHGDVLYFQIKARALCPTKPFNAPDKPKRSFCEHCQSWSFEDKFHSGTCENCGAPYQRITA